MCWERQPVSSPVGPLAALWAPDSPNLLPVNIDVRGGSLTWDENGARFNLPWLNNQAATIEEDIPVLDWVVTVDQAPPGDVTKRMVRELPDLKTLDLDSGKPPSMEQAPLSFLTAVVMGSAGLGVPAPIADWLGVQVQPRPAS